MKVILTENVSALGNAGDVVDVKRGHFRNFLFPRNLAVESTPKNVKALDHQKRIFSAQIEKGFTDAKKFGEKLESLSLTLARKVGEQDKLFGSVTDMDIEAALKEQGFDISRKQILLEEPIKTLGVYHVPIRLYQDVEIKLKVWVIKE